MYVERGVSDRSYENVVAINGELRWGLRASAWGWGVLLGPEGAYKCFFSPSSTNGRAIAGEF